MAAIPAFHLPLPSAARVPARARTLLVAGCVLAALLGLGVARLAAPREIDADLVVLLRAMAVIKAALVAAAIGAVSWRLGLPTTPRVAFVYGASVALMSFATALIWMTAFIGLAALAFHAGLFAALFAAWRDDRVTSLRPTR
jgi:hypothetical protein